MIGALGLYADEAYLLAQLSLTNPYLCACRFCVASLAGGCGIEGEDDSYDFGSGAGFYVDATEDKWKTNYRMYSYITKEVSDVVW